jgi:hypothetical protein
MGEKRNACAVLVWRVEGNTPLGRPRHRWANSIKLGLNRLGERGLGQLRVVIRKEKLLTVSIILMFK